MATDGDTVRFMATKATKKEVARVAESRRRVDRARLALLQSESEYNALLCGLQLAHDAPAGSGLRDDGSWAPPPARPAPASAAPGKPVPPTNGVPGARPSV